MLEIDTPATPASVAAQPPELELEDIQGTVLRFTRLLCGTYIFARIDDAAHGREFLRRIADDVTTAAEWWDSTLPYTLNVAISYQGLRALGAPQDSLESFPEEFQQGMAARAALLGDIGESDPSQWDGGLGTPGIHLLLNLHAQDLPTLERLIAFARVAHEDLTGIVEVFRQDGALNPTLREHFGYRDAIADLIIEGAGDHRPGQGAPIKAGEFVLGYPDLTGLLPPMPRPDALGRNGTFLAIRKLRQDVAAFRRYLASQAETPEGQEVVAAKLVGRWRSGAPLALSPDRDDPALAADPLRNNTFGYADDLKGLRVPRGAHIRRVNPRDGLGDDAVYVSRHRMVRRGFGYGPPLPEGVLEDDGVDRGTMFVFMGASLSRQFEFIQRTWINSGTFVGLEDEKDPIAGANDGTGTFTIPQPPVRRRLRGLPRFVTVKGGEYFFLPSVRALRWLAAGGQDTVGSSNGTLRRNGPPATSIRESSDGHTTHL